MKTFQTHIRSQPKIINELAHFSDILTKKGNIFVDNLLKQHVSINVKVDVSSFNLKKENGVIKFYGREGKQEIDILKRAGFDLYEDAIRHIKARKWQKIPDGIEVYMELFSDKMPTIIKYKSPPKNNLIISYLKKNNKILPPCNPLNEQVSKILDIEGPPLLFSGKISASQQNRILKFIELSDEEKIEFIQTKFEGKFINFVLSLFIPKKDISILQATGLEGLVFYFGNPKNPSDIFMAKIVDPLFTAEIKKKKSKNADSKFMIELTELIFKDLEKFIDITLKKRTQFQYIEFIMNLLSNYIKERKNIFDRRLEKYKKEISDNPFNISYGLVPPKVNQLISKYFWAEDLFRVLLFNLKTKKKRATKIFDKKKKGILNSQILKMKMSGKIL